jgi:GT2 family glycosyltransferase
MIAVIVVTYNAEKWLAKCLGSLIDSILPIHIIVLDNKSTDQTANLIKNNYPAVELVETGANMGFAKANNIGIRMALLRNYDYVFLLNQDAWIEPYTLERLHEAGNRANPQYGLLSPVHLNGTGDKLEYFFHTSSCGFTDDFRNFYADLFLKREIGLVYEVGFVNAAAWLVQTSVFRKVGLFDDDIFPHYGEDNNWMNRLAYHGYKAGIVPSAKIYHDTEDRLGKFGGQTDFSSHLKLFRFKLQLFNQKNLELNWDAESELKRNLMKSLASILKMDFPTFSMRMKYYKEMKSLFESASSRIQSYKKPGFNLPDPNRD